MAERERLTNKERRAQAREERKRKEAEQAKQRKRNQLRNGLITATVVAVVGAVVLSAFLGGPDVLDDTVLVSSEAAESAREAAGCEVIVDREPLPDRSHFPANAAPDADSIYGDVRPTHSGPHTETFHPIIADGASRQLDERSTTHNLEHGAIFAWYDPEQLSGDEIAEMERWAETLNANGFRVDRAGTAIFVAPFTDPGISSGQAIAFRAWGVAEDCDSFDEDMANAFVIEHYGTHGIAPERTFAPFPNEVMQFSDREVEDSDAPLVPDSELDEQQDQMGDGDVETDEDATTDAEDGDAGDADADQPADTEE